MRKNLLQENNIQKSHGKWGFSIFHGFFHSFSGQKPQLPIFLYAFIFTADIGRLDGFNTIKRLKSIYQYYGQNWNFASFIIIMTLFDVPIIENCTLQESIDNIREFSTAYRDTAVFLIQRNLLQLHELALE